MTKRANSRYKINRALGVNLWGRPKSSVNKRASRPGQHGAAPKKMSDYGEQLKAKQKLKFYYANLTEKKFSAIYKKAAARPGDTIATMVKTLESRLDVVVYRMKFAVTLQAARQLVNHGHIRVNGSCVDRPSYQVSLEDVISVADRSKSIPPVVAAVELEEREVPAYIECDHAKKQGKMTRFPELSEVPYPVQMDYRLVVEFYSR